MGFLNTVCQGFYNFIGVHRGFLLKGFCQRNFMAAFRVSGLKALFLEEKRPRSIGRKAVLSGRLREGSGTLSCPRGSTGRALATKRRLTPCSRTARRSRPSRKAVRLARLAGRRRRRMMMSLLRPRCVTGTLNPKPLNP